MIGLIESVKAFGTSPKYTQRQEYLPFLHRFLIMCEKLMNNPELFRVHFLPIMVELSDDKVVNVKLVLAEIVKKHIDIGGSMSEDPELLQLRDKLMADEDEEVESVFKEE